MRCRMTGRESVFWSSVMITTIFVLVGTGGVGRGVGWAWQAVIRRRRTRLRIFTKILITA